VLIVAQALTLVATPLVLVLMMILLNREDLMGKYKAKPITNIVFTVVALFTFAMAIIGIIGILESF
jgi:Mn2+/Fe2+ NRAMP family transporter